MTEYEIDQGLFSAPNPAKDCLVFYRNIAGLDSMLDNRRAAKFTDLVQGTTNLDTGKQEMNLIIDVFEGFILQVRNRRDI